MAEIGRRIITKTESAIDRLLTPGQPEPRYITPFDSKTRFTMIGPVGSGKTTIAAGMLITAETRSQEDPDFFCDVMEYGSNIKEAAWDLRYGMFPPKTRPTGEYAYESGLKITKKALFGSKELHIPLIDVAGEDQQVMLAKHTSPLEARNPVNYLTHKTLLNYMKSSEGFILTLCAPRIPMPGEQLEKEPDDISRYPDVNISRLFQEVIEYKRKHRGKHIRGVAVVITKWDVLAPYLIDKGINLYAPGGIRRFMNIYFPGTSMQLKKLEEQGVVKYFPSHFALEKNEKGQTVTWPNGAPKIEVLTQDPSTGEACLKPNYAEASYMTMFDYFESFAR